MSRAKNEDYQTRRNPLQRIAVLLNKYHSVDLLYGTKEDKEYTKSIIKKDIYKQLKYVSEDIHATIKASIRSKDIWDDTKNRIL